MAAVGARPITAPGWTRRCNLNTGDFNNDLTLSDTPGDTWTWCYVHEAQRELSGADRGKPVGRAT